MNFCPVIRICCILASTLVLAYSAPVSCSDGQEMKNGGCEPCNSGFFRNGNMTVCRKYSTCYDVLVIEFKGNSTHDVVCRCNDTTYSYMLDGKCFNANCSVGNYFSKDAGSCTPCPTDTWKNKTGHEECSKCTHCNETAHECNSTQDAVCAIADSKNGDAPGDEGNGNMSGGAIVGIVILVLVLVGCFVGAVIYRCRNRCKTRSISRPSNGETVGDESHRGLLQNSSQSGQNGGMATSRQGVSQRAETRSCWQCFHQYSCWCCSTQDNRSSVTRNGSNEMPLVRPGSHDSQANEPENQQDIGGQMNEPADEQVIDDRQRNEPTNQQDVNGQRNELENQQGINGQVNEPSAQQVIDDRQRNEPTNQQNINGQTNDTTAPQILDGQSCERANQPIASGQLLGDQPLPMSPADRDISLSTTDHDRTKIPESSLCTYVHPTSDPNVQFAGVKESPFLVHESLPSQEPASIDLRDSRDLNADQTTASGEQSANQRRESDKPRDSRGSSTAQYRSSRERNASQSRESGEPSVAEAPLWDYEECITRKHRTIKGSLTLEESLLSFLVEKKILTLEQLENIKHIKKSDGEPDAVDRLIKFLRLRGNRGFECFIEALVSKEVLLDDLARIIHPELAERFIQEQATKDKDNNGSSEPQSGKTKIEPKPEPKELVSDDEDVDYARPVASKKPVGSGETKIKSIDVGETQIKSIDSGETQIKSIDSGETPIKSIDSGETPVKSIDSGETPVKSIDSVETPVKSVGSGETPIKTLSSVDY